MNLRGLLVGLAISWAGCSHGTVRPPSSNDRTLAERVRAFQARLARDGSKAWPGFKLVPGTFVVIDEHQAECFGADCPAPFRQEGGVAGRPFCFKYVFPDEEAWDWTEVPPAPAERTAIERSTATETYATGRLPFELAMAEDAFDRFVGGWPTQGERIVGLFFLGFRQLPLSEPGRLEEARSEEKILSSILRARADERLVPSAAWAKISERLAALPHGDDEERLTTYLGLDRYFAARVIEGRERAASSVAADLAAGLGDLWPEYWLLYQRPFVVGEALAVMLDGLEPGWKRTFATDRVTLAEKARARIAGLGTSTEGRRASPWVRSFSPENQGGEECEQVSSPGSAIVLVAGRHGDRYFFTPLRATSDPRLTAKALGDAFVLGPGYAARLSGRVQADVATREACLHLDGKRAIEAVARALASIPPNEPAKLRFETPQLGIESSKAKVTSLPSGRGWRIEFSPP